MSDTLGMIVKSDTAFEDELTSDVRLYVDLSTQMEKLKAQRDAVKSRLMAVVEMKGTPDSSGHDWVELPTPVGNAYGIQRQHRIKKTPDEDAILSILKRKNLIDRCLVVKEVVDEQEIMACLAQGELTEEDINMMYPSTTTYAFTVVKAK